MKMKVMRGVLILECGIKGRGGIDVEDRVGEMGGVFRW
jgi:hypothetical protein